MTIRVLVVDDHPVFRAGLVAILEDLDDVEVVAQAADGKQAIDAVASHRPGVVLMDLRMPGIGGLGATARITLHHPNTAVIVLTMDSDHDSVFAALRAGARGYLLKEADGDDVQRALHAVAKGEAVFGPRIAEQVLSFFATPRLATAADPFPQLTPREREILEMIAQGLDNAVIARRLVLTEKSVRNRVSDILTKLRARSRAEAVSLARNAGLGGEQASRTTIHSGFERDPANRADLTSFQASPWHERPQPRGRVDCPTPGDRVYLQHRLPRLLRPHKPYPRCGTRAATAEGWRAIAE